MKIASQPQFGVGTGVINAREKQRLTTIVNTIPRFGNTAKRKELSVKPKIQTKNACGTTSLSMVMAYYGKQVEPKAEQQQTEYCQQPGHDNPYTKHNDVPPQVVTARIC